MNNISVVSVNVSEEKGTVKTPVSEIVVNPSGIVGDAHSGSWHRQISILAQESVDRFGAEAGRKIKAGEFAENITTSGIDLMQTAILDRFRIGNVELEVTQIGKKCHGSECAIFHEVGKCVMPKEGIFCRVLAGGVVRPGDRVLYTRVPLRFRVITLSDRASRGEYADRSGPEIERRLIEHFEHRHWHAEFTRVIIPDEETALRAEVRTAGDERVDVLFTTGGTGIGPRDITPDVLLTLFDKTIPGIMESIRMKHGDRIPSALLSRSVAGTVGGTLVYALPGSVKAVGEYMDEILRSLQHAVYTIKQIDIHGH